MKTKPDLLHGLIMNPGDKVLVAIRHAMTPMEAQSIKDRLSERFPEVEFTLVSDVVSVAVQKRTPDEVAVEA